MIQTRVLTGDLVEPVLDELASLRIKVFRDWPYLYDGDVEYEREYLAAYRSPGAVVVAVYDGRALVGASTGTPLLLHADDFADAFAQTNQPLDEIFYCAESVLLSKYRGRGLGHTFFDEREDHARALGLRFSAFAAVERSDEHPLKPASYRSLDSFWRRRGYVPLDGAMARFEWKDIDQDGPTSKELQFWMRAL